jgi:hypothetical protein
VTVLGRRLRQTGVLAVQTGGDAIWRYELWQLSRSRWRIEVVNVSSGARIVRDYDSIDELSAGLAQVHQAGEEHGVWTIAHASDWRAGLPST